MYFFKHQGFGAKYFVKMSLYILFKIYLSSAVTLVMHPEAVCLHMPISLWCYTSYNREIHQLSQFFKR